VSRSKYNLSYIFCANCSSFFLSFFLSVPANDLFEGPPGDNILHVKHDAGRIAAEEQEDDAKKNVGL
jgi:hypothetical protein